MKRTLLLILVMLVAVYCKAQKLGLELEFGIGSYKMDNLKELNQYIQKEVAFKTAVTDNFPVYPYFKASAFLLTNQKQIGLSFSFHSTGSRISAVDYSGEYKYDNLLKAYMAGLFIQAPARKLGKMQVEGRLEGGVIYSELRNEQYLQLFDTVYIDNSFLFKSINTYLEPGLRLSFPVFKFKLGVYAGYMLQFGKKGFYIESRNTTQVTNPATNSVLKPEWNGFRMSVSLAYPM
jgi:hypothetical protein